jgi:hypothetical protein
VQAAIGPDVRGGDYWGPDGFAELWGEPAKVGCSARARSAGDARRLFDVSEELTGVRFGALPA